MNKQNISLKQNTNKNTLLVIDLKDFSIADQQLLTRFYQSFDQLSMIDKSAIKILIDNDLKG